MNKQFVKFNGDEQYAIQQVIEQIRGKQFCNIYFFTDFRTGKWHIFHHTEQNKECQLGFEEGIFTLLRTLEIKYYYVIVANKDNIKVDKIFTNTSICLSNINHNLGD